MIDSFILYTRYKNNIKSLSREQKGYLLELIFDYEESVHQKEPDIDDGLVAMAFSFIKNDLDNNLERYQKAVNSGKKGGRPKQNNPFEQENLKVNDPFLDRNLKVSEDKTPSQDPFEQENLNDNEYEYVDEDVNKKKSKKEKDFSFESVCDSELLSSLKEFEKMRKSIKKPLTPRARSMLWNKLGRLAKDEETKIQILKQSIFHCWQDVYELDSNPKKQSNIPNYDQSFTDTSLSVSDADYEQFMRKRGI